MTALTMLKEGVSTAHIAADLQVSKHAISDLKQVVTGLPDNTVPTRKAGTGMKKRTTDGTNAVWPRYVILNHSINHANLKNKQHILLPGIYIRAIQHSPRRALICHHAVRLRSPS